MGKIEIKGPIISDSEQWIYDYFEEPATSPKKVNEAISGMDANEEIEIIMNSPGGSVFAGSEIYTVIKSHKGKTIGKVVGIAASAASVIAMGVDELLLSPTAQLMIHRASTYGVGNKNDFEHTADVLSGVDESIAHAYQLKTGMETNELLNLMSKETFLTATKAKELGFSDGIMFENENSFVNSVVGSDGIIPKSVIDKMQAEFKGKIPAEPKEPDNTAKKAKAIAIAKYTMAK